MSQSQGLAPKEIRLRSINRYQNLLIAHALEISTVEAAEANAATGDVTVTDDNDPN